jgi:hypothetical protein
VLDDGGAGAGAGLASWEPVERSQAQREVRVRLGVDVSLGGDFSAGLESAGSLAFSLPFPLILSASFSLLEVVGLAPATVPPASFLVYPNMESPSQESCRAKFGIDLDGLESHEIGETGVSTGRV